VTKAFYSKKLVPELWTLYQAQFPGNPKPKKSEMVDQLFNANKTSTWKRVVQNCKAGSVADLAPAIQSSLDARKDLWKGADLVVFENQPDRRMFAVQCMLHMYFVARGFKVKGVSATHKLENTISLQDKTNTYKGRKKTGIVHASALCPATWKDYMLKHPKKDDLADTCMQALSFIDRVVEEPVADVKSRPRKPTENQTRTKYSKANLAWLVVQKKHTTDKRFEKDLKRYYHSLDELLNEFNI
jgi:hypothetical protein